MSFRQSISRLVSNISSSILSTLLPLAPRIVPVLVCAFLVPLIILLSFAAGWVVWTTLSVGWEVPLFLQYGDGTSPFAHVTLSDLAPQQRYHVFVDLLIPFTEANLQLGNFMTHLTVATTNNKTLAHVRRPAIALPPTPKLFFSTPISSTTRIQMLDSFVPGANTLLATVEIGRRDNWKTLGQGQGRELSVISATLRGIAVPHGLRGLAIRFPLLSSAAAGLVFMLILSTIVGLCILPQLIPSPSDDDDVYATKGQPGSKSRPSSRGVDERGRRRRSRSAKSEPEVAAVKSEPFPQTIPSPASTSKTLRKRSSRSSVNLQDSS